MATGLNNDWCDCGGAQYWSPHHVALIDPDTGRFYHALRNHYAVDKNGKFIPPCGGYFRFNEKQRMDYVYYKEPHLPLDYLDWLPD
jgi:hypothetical protein